MNPTIQLIINQIKLSSQLLEHMENPIGRARIATDIEDLASKLRIQSISEAVFEVKHEVNPKVQVPRVLDKSAR